MFNVSIFLKIVVCYDLTHLKKSGKSFQSKIDTFEDGSSNHWQPFDLKQTKDHDKLCPKQSLIIGILESKNANSRLIFSTKGICL